MSIFDRDMSIEVLKNGRGILKIPEGITELSYDFALVFDWGCGHFLGLDFQVRVRRLSSESETLPILHWAHPTKRFFNAVIVVPLDIAI